jgi:hypothetical protein
MIDRSDPSGKRDRGDGKRAAGTAGGPFEIPQRYQGVKTSSARAYQVESVPSTEPRS